MENKEELIKKLLEEFEKECNKLGVNYLISVGNMVKLSANSIYLATVIYGTLKGIPVEERKKTTTLLYSYLAEEDDDIEINQLS